MNKVTGALLIVAGAIFFLGRILLEGFRMDPAKQEQLIGLSNFAAGLCVAAGILFVSARVIRSVSRKLREASAYEADVAGKQVGAGSKREPMLGQGQGTANS